AKLSASTPATPKARRVGPRPPAEGTDVGSSGGLAGDGLEGRPQRGQGRSRSVAGWEVRNRARHPSQTTNQAPIVAPRGSQSVWLRATCPSTITGPVGERKRRGAIEPVRRMARRPVRGGFHDGACPGPRTPAWAIGPGGTGRRGGRGGGRRR